MNSNQDDYIDENRFARVKVIGAERRVVIPISFRKPHIPDAILEKWQGIVDLVARIIRVPTGLITRLMPEDLEIFIASNTQGNPYKKFDHDKLGIGMFCESVAGTQKRLLVDDAEKIEYWRNNPHAALGMRAYLGVPILWDDGELFGTFCMLDDKSNSFSAEYIEIMEKFKALIETDLRYILLQEELQTRLSVSELRLREIHHRLKNQFAILIGYIGLQSKIKSDVELNDVLKEVQHRIMALSLIHENLYRSNSLTELRLDVYIPRLCSYIVNDFTKHDVAIEYSIDDITLSVDSNISLALIVSELLTNSLKHAFSGVDSKRIWISAKRSGENDLSFVYRDNGKGLPDGFDTVKAETLGMELIVGLAKQLRGSMTASNDGGAVFTFVLHC